MAPAADNIRAPMQLADRNDSPHVPRRWFAAVAALLALLLLAWQVHWLWPYVSDDAFISLRYAERLVDGKGLTWNDGEHVEGYSNLLWVLATAGLLRVGMDGLTALRVLGALCSGLAIVVTAFGLRQRRAGEAGATLAAPLMLAASPPLAAWTCGGLEGPMLLLWGCCGLVLLLPALGDDEVPRRRCLWAGVPLALMCLTRPDAPLWVAATGFVAAMIWFLDRGFAAALSRLTALAFVPFLAIAGQVMFRVSCYGDWLPNTAYVKTGISRLSLQAGLQYVSGASAALGGVLLFAAIGLLLLWRLQARRRGLVLAVPVLVFYGYLIAVGGDHFVAWRMFFMVLAPLVLLGGLGLQQLGGRGVGSALLALLFGLGLPALQLFLTRHDERTLKARDEVWEWQGKSQGEALGRAFATEQPLLAVDGAGVVPYYSRLPCLDMLGLNDRTIARTDPEQDGPLLHFTPGHTHGNGAYVLSRQPDLVQFSHPPGTDLPSFPSGSWLEASADFRRDYRCVHFDIDTPMPPDWQPERVRGVLWVRLLGKVGVQLSSGRVEVPAFLLGSLLHLASVQNLPPQLGEGDWRLPALLAGDRWRRQQSAAVPAGDGFALELRDEVAALQELPLGKGRWRVALEPADAAVAVGLRDAAGTLLPRDGELWRWDGGPVTLEVRATDAARLPLQLRRVVLTVP